MGDHSEFDNIDSKPEGERNRVLLNLELSGNTSFIPRFFDPEDIPNADNSLRQKRDRDFEDMLALLLAEDQSYAQLYLQVERRLDDVQSAVDKAMSDINRRLDDASKELSDINAQASTLNDGTKVFRSENDGQIYTEAGEKLSDEQASSFNIQDNQPSYEEYLEKANVKLEAQREKAEVEDYQRNVVDPIRARMNDRNDPPSKEELEEALELLSDKSMPTSVARYTQGYENRIQASEKLTDTTPDLREDFRVANFNIPSLEDLEFAGQSGPPRLPGGPVV